MSMTLAICTTVIICIWSICAVVIYAICKTKGMVNITHEETTNIGIGSNENRSFRAK